MSIINQIYNPAFGANVTNNTALENNLTGGTAVLSRDTAVFAKRGAAAKIVITTPANSEIWRVKLRMNETNLFSVVSGQTYTISCYIKTSDARQIQLALENVGATVGNYSALLNTTSTGLTRVSFTFTASASYSAKFNVIVNNGSTGSIWISNAMLQSGSTLSPYFDGSFAPSPYTSSWSGTADNSTSTEADARTDMSVYQNNTAGNGNSSEVSSSIDWTSFRWLGVLTKEVSTLSFNIKKTPGKAAIALGDQIDFYDDTTHMFGGTVTEKKTVVQGNLLLVDQITCTDWGYRINSKLVTKIYTAIDPGNVVKDIISTFAQQGFTTNNVQLSGFNLTSMAFNYEQPTRAIEKIAKQIGWEWYVDADKDVHFFPPTSLTPAPFNIDDAAGNLEWPTIEIDQSIQNMRNSVYVIGGNYSKTFDATTTLDKYTTDGTRITFPLAYSYTLASIVVTLDGVSQTIGAINSTTDPATVNVLYSEGGKFVQFTTTPAANKVVKIYGSATIPITAHTDNQSAVATYGEYQDAIIDKNIKTVQEAQQRAGADIEQYGVVTYNVRFQTIRPGLSVGQTITINSTKFGFNMPLIVQRVEGACYGPQQMEYTVECNGTDNVTFTDIMLSLLNQANNLAPADPSAILQVLKSFIESATISETLVTPTTKTGPYTWDDSTKSKWNYATWA